MVDLPLAFITAVRREGIDVTILLMVVWYMEFLRTNSSFSCIVKCLGAVFQLLLINPKTFSIGFKSGDIGGMKSVLKPHAERLAVV